MGKAAWVVLPSLEPEQDQCILLHKLPLAFLALLP